ncbi:type 4a pilus biogenesis protein PilO [Patescibacteria group bacterium]|nr:type 4a pilus biogenesis protein PilO [Patescibacteria group bacterium]MCL5091717.1 type 4a pilus biogenesis protein PilO [Patescibacteria group bacterium]
MRKSDIKKLLFANKVKDYSFTVAFFLIFSFFLVFIIKPNVVLVFNLEKEKTALTDLNNNYENVIANIVGIQTELEKSRDDLYLIKQAIPSVPDVNVVVNDVRQSASDTGLIIKKFDINQVNLKYPDSTDKEAHTLEVSLESEADFPTARAFIDSLLNQRRLKKFSQITIANPPKAASGGANLKIDIQLQGFYL